MTATDPQQPVTRHRVLNMKRPIALVLTLLISVSAQAEELCAGWEMKIEPDHQFQESDFTLEAALASLEYLADLSREPRHELSGFAEHNSLVLVEGWLLKKAAIEAKAKDQGAAKLHEVRHFCEFLVNKAVIHD